MLAKAPTVKFPQTQSSGNKSRMLGAALALGETLHEVTRYVDRTHAWRRRRANIRLTVGKLNGAKYVVSGLCTAMLRNNPQQP